MRQITEGIWNQGRLELVGDLISEDFVDHVDAPGQEGTGPARYRSHVETTGAMPSDIRNGLDLVVPLSTVGGRSANQAGAGSTTSTSLTPGGRTPTGAWGAFSACRRTYDGSHPQRKVGCWPVPTAASIIQGGQLRGSGAHTAARARGARHRGEAAYDPMDGRGWAWVSPRWDRAPAPHRVDTIADVSPKSSPIFATGGFRGPGTGKEAAPFVAAHRGREAPARALWAAQRNTPGRSAAWQRTCFGTSKR